MLHNQVDSVVLVNDLVQFYHIGVVDVSQNIDLILQSGLDVPE